VSLSVDCRMNVDQLAIIFGPAVVGWSDELDPVKDPKDQQLVSRPDVFYTMLSFKHARLAVLRLRTLSENLLLYIVYSQ